MGLRWWVEWLSEATHVRWTEDGAVPVCHEEVVAFIETVGACLWGAVSVVDTTEKWQTTYLLPSLSRPSRAPRAA